MGTDLFWGWDVLGDRQGLGKNGRKGGFRMTFKKGIQKMRAFKKRGGRVCQGPGKLLPGN